MHKSPWFTLSRHDEGEPEPTPTPAEGGEGKPEKTFTQAELDAIVGDRLKRQKGQFSDYESLKEKAARLDAVEAEKLSAEQKATARAEAAEKAAAETARKSAERIATAELRAALVGLVDNPADVIEDLNLAKFIGEDGEVDADAVSKVQAKYAAIAAKKPAAPPATSIRAGVATTRRSTTARQPRPGEGRAVEARRADLAVIHIKAVLGDGLTSIVVDGHEGHQVDGRVCAAVTAITQTALLGLEAYAAQYPHLVTLEIKEHSVIRTARIRSWFRLDRHDIRSSLPAAIQAIVQNGLLYKAFEDALVPDFLFPMTANRRGWSGGLGDTSTFTRPGLLDPGHHGADRRHRPVRCDVHGGAVLGHHEPVRQRDGHEPAAVGDRAVQQVHRGQPDPRHQRRPVAEPHLADEAVQRLRRRSHVVHLDRHVHDDRGEQHAGLRHCPRQRCPDPVSGTNPLSITVNGVANTVTAVNSATSLTLGSSITTAVGQTVIAANAPFSLRGGTSKNARYNLAAGDVATAAVFRSAVARLRTMAVPTVNGNYVAHVDPTTEAQLFADADFKQAYQGRADSAVFRDMSIGVFLGIDWVRNVEAPTTTDGGSGANLLIHQPIVMGANALISAPFEDMGGLLAGVSGPHGAIELISPAPGVQVAHIIRPPQDRLQQIVSSSWSYVGDYSVPSDSGTGDAALFKRAVVIEHTDS
jgi:hypothetical protein